MFAHAFSTLLFYVLLRPEFMAAMNVPPAKGGFFENKLHSVTKMTFSMATMDDAGETRLQGPSPLPVAIAL